MEDTLDSLLTGSDDEAEEDAVVSRVLDEIGIEINSKVWKAFMEVPYNIQTHACTHVMHTCTYTCTITYIHTCTHHTHTSHVHTFTHAQHNALPLSPQLSGVGVAGHKLGGAEKSKDVDDIESRLQQLHN